MSSASSSSPDLSSPVCAESTPLSLSLKSDWNIFVDKLQAFLYDLAQQDVILTEWDILLAVRYNVPVVITTFDFLVEDNLLESSCRTAEKFGFRRAPNNPRNIRLYGEYETIAWHFSLPNSIADLRFNLYPTSYVGLHADEIYLTSSKIGTYFRLSGVSQAVSIPVFVPKLVPLVACLVRMSSRLPMDDKSRVRLRHDLESAIVYNLFDMSYEGDYQIFDETQEEMDKSIENALELYRKWEGWRAEEMWIADAVEWFVRGKADFRHFPSKS